MSAFIVSDRHISALLRAGLERDGYGQTVQWPLTRANASEVGAMMLRENIASVVYRYDKDEPSRYPNANPEQFRFRDSLPLSPVETLKLISSYEYQSCEHPAWECSDARRFCEALRQHAIGRLPGWDKAAWTI